MSTMQVLSSLLSSVLHVWDLGGVEASTIESDRFSESIEQLGVEVS